MNSLNKCVGKICIHSCGWLRLVCSQRKPGRNKSPHETWHFVFATQAEVPSKQLLRLEVTAEDEEFHDLGYEWLEKNLEEVMLVETNVLAALDTSLSILMPHISFLKDKPEKPSNFRKLCVWLLAVRHNYLDSVVYSKAAELESSVMEKVNILVVSGSNLIKIGASQSNWSEWFANHRSLGLLCVDEVPGMSIESVAAAVLGFPCVVLCGDRNQFHTEQRQTPVTASIGTQNTGHKKQDPLLRHNAAAWLERLSKEVSENADSVPSYFQYRYGADTIKFMQQIFPPFDETLSCPEDFHNTLILPYFFEPIHHQWDYSESTEVSRNSTIFTHVLAIVATEMVLAQARGCRSGHCQVLVMWCLKTPLNQLLEFLDASLADACWKVHELWRIREPRGGCANTYNLSAWMRDQRFQAKAGQSAHGSHSEIALWFFVQETTRR